VAKIIADSGTAAGATRSLGTPLYMPPEQFNPHAKLSGAADIYALGMMAYTLLVGEPYWRAEAGSAGNAVAFALARAGVAAVTIHNRTASRAADLAQRLCVAYPRCAVTVGPKDARGFDVAVNATSVGLRDNELSFEVSELAPSTLVAEVIMKPEKTALILAAEGRGCPAQQGKHMLDYQMDLMFDFMQIGANECK